VCVRVCLTGECKTFHLWFGGHKTIGRKQRIAAPMPLPSSGLTAGCAGKRGSIAPATVGTPERFASSKQLSSYIGLVPSEESSGERRCLRHISKQGNTLLRFLLVAAAQATVRSDGDHDYVFGLPWERGAGCPIIHAAVYF